MENKKLNLQSFLEQSTSEKLKDNNYLESLKSAPYSLIIREENGYYLLKYNQIESDFSNPIVKEARGIILDGEKNFEVVCKPFNKFFNYGEKEADEIDWNSAFIQEKVDGSILKLWFSYRLNKWIYSTNGVIFGEEANVMFPLKNIHTFGDMIKASGGYDFDTSLMNKDYTYIFEIVGPQNRIVIPYSENRMYYLTTISNTTYEEHRNISPFENFALYPKEYSFTSLKETLEFVSSENFNNFKNEGFVVSDKYGHRIKIKTEEYLRVHRLRGETIPTVRNVLEMLKEGEQKEFLSYFPEYKDLFEEVSYKLKNYISTIQTDFYFAKEKKNLPRKDFALWAKKQLNPSLLFTFLDEKISNDYNEIKNWLLQSPSFIKKMQKEIE